MRFESQMAMPIHKNYKILVRDFNSEKLKSHKKSIVFKKDNKVNLLKEIFIFSWI